MLNEDIGQANDTTQWVTRGENIIMTRKDRYGQIEIENIPLQKITNFQPFMEENHAKKNMFEKLNSDFNMVPEEIYNPFMKSSREPTIHHEHEHEQGHHEHERHEHDRHEHHHQNNKKSKKNKRNKRNKTPHKKKISPRNKPVTQRIQQLYRNKIVKTQS